MKRIALASALIALAALLPGAGSVRAGALPAMIVVNSTNYSGWVEAISDATHTTLALKPNAQVAFGETGVVFYRAILVINGHNASLPDMKMTVHPSSAQKLVIKVQGSRPYWFVGTAVDASGGFQ